MPRPFEKGHKLARGGAREGAGRPPEWLREKCREHAPDILGFLIQVSLGQDVEQVITEDGETVRVPAPVRERIKASEIVLNRGYGMPNQPLSGPEGEGLSLIPAPDLSALVNALRSRFAGGSGKGTGKATGK